MPVNWRDYRAGGYWDELVTAAGRARPEAKRLLATLAGLSDAELRERRTAAEIAIRTMGITFTVYDGSANTDREWPFDIVPRLIRHDEWEAISAGLKQRVRALNAFIDDVYHAQRFLREGHMPAELVLRSREFRRQCVGVEPPRRVWAHVCGSDLVRDENGKIYVLEDNLRVPSGVSYMLENRAVMKRVFPELFEHYHIRAMDDYPARLAACLRSLAPPADEPPRIVVLTPGIHNSAYFEHAYLAREMGMDLVQGEDLFVGADDRVYMKTIRGPLRVDVIYRRIDDTFLDPEAFRPDSVLGVAGLVRAWRAGNVALANAPGCGVADDKVIYSFVPEMIRFYLGEEPLLANVPTYRCVEKAARDHVLANLERLVVKPANESGGYGILIGPQATRKEREECARAVRANPRNFIAQPLVKLSTAPTLVGGNSIEPRHLDLRPFVLSGRDIDVTTGGLTRVALRKGSTVVNSSQGGGSKDTWVVETETGRRSGRGGKA